MHVIVRDVLVRIDAIILEDIETCGAEPLDERMTEPLRFECRRRSALRWGHRATCDQEIGVIARSGWLLQAAGDPAA